VRESKPASGVPPQPVTAFPLASSKVDRTLGAGHAATVALFDGSVPTPAALRLLGDEVRKAIDQPKSVAHPELADPEVYWRLSAFPQAASLVRQLRALLVEVAAEVAPVVPGSHVDFDVWMRAAVAAEAPHRRVDPDASRAAIIDQIAERCGELHEIIAGLGQLSTGALRIDTLRNELAGLRGKRIDEEVRRSGDAPEVAEARLRQDPPFRHQDLLLDAFELARSTFVSDVAEMIDALTAPIFGLGERMVMSYDAVVAAMDAPTAHISPAP
jgi:hypothetical protein